MDNYLGGMWKITGVDLLKALSSYCLESVRKTMKNRTAGHRTEI
jgi:hypothetical protein